jgi:Tfp pilus assembly protein PilV
MRCNFPWNSTRAARRGRRSTRARSEAGFSLIEVLVSALLVALIAAAVAQALIATTRTSAAQRGRSQADEVAQQDQERLRGLSAQQLNGLSQTRTVTLDGIGFTVTSTAQFLNASAGASCSGSGTTAAYFSIVSSVNWTSNANRPAVREESVITPPAGGTLLTKVVDQTGAPLSGVSVSATGPDTAAGVTDSTGCVVLAALATGSYAITLTDAGYVDLNANPSPLSTSATVSSTGTATPSGGNPITMGLAGAINASFTAAGATGAQQASALSWLGTGSSTGMSSSSTYGPVATPATTLPATGTIQLFPFAFTGPSYANNYQVWAGKCRQMQPPIGQDMASVTPGSSQTVPVKEPGLNVVVQWNGARVAPADVKMSFASTSGPSCTDSWLPAISSTAASSATGVLASPGQPFASTATTGTTESASTYTGTLSICADYLPPGTGQLYHYTTTTTPSPVTNTSFTALTPVTLNILTASTATKCP